MERHSLHDTPVFSLTKDDVPVVAHYVHTHPSLRGTLSLLWAVDHRPHTACYELFYLFTLAERRDWLLLSTELQDDDRFFPSITPHVHAAQWYEREIRDMFGLIPLGHPDLRRLVRHEHWPKGHTSAQERLPMGRDPETGTGRIRVSSDRGRGSL